MYCGIQYDGFPCFQNLMACIFSFKIQLVEMSKQKEVKSSLNSLSGPKQDHESNTTSTTLAAAPIKKTQKFRQESWKGSTLTKKKTKCSASFAGNGNSMHYSLRIGTNNFQTDSLKAYKAGEGHRL